jgi:hypothetical protein
MAEQENSSNTNPLDQSKVINWLGTQLQVLLHFMKPDFSFGDHHRVGSHRWAFIASRKAVLIQGIPVTKSFF